MLPLLTNPTKSKKFGVSAFLIILFLRCLWWVPTQLIKGEFGFAEMFWGMWTLGIVIALVFGFFKIKKDQKKDKEKEIERKKKLAKKYSWYQPKI